MTNVEKTLLEKNLVIPACPVPIASYVPARVEGRFVYLSGQTAWVDGVLQYKGKLGEEISTEDGYESAKLAALRCISELRSVADLDKVRIVKVTGYVNSAPDYVDQPKVVNGASVCAGFWGKGPPCPGSHRHERIAGRGLGGSGSHRLY